ncbi:hypothetical protein JCM11491_003342 [Sporobolomyces phaffii]
MGKRSRAAADAATAQPALTRDTDAVSAAANNNNTASTSTSAREDERAAKKARKAEKRLNKMLSDPASDKPKKDKKRKDAATASEDPTPPQLAPAEAQEQDASRKKHKKHKKSKESGTPARDEVRTRSHPSSLVSSAEATLTSCYPQPVTGTSNSTAAARAPLEKTDLRHPSPPKKSKKSSKKTVTFEPESDSSILNAANAAPAVDALMTFDFVANPAPDLPSASSSSSELPIPPAHFLNRATPSTNGTANARGVDDDVVVSTESPAGAEGSTKKGKERKSKKDKKEKQDKKDKKHKKDKRKDRELLVDSNDNDDSMQIDPLLIAIDADAEKGNGRERKDKGKGKGKGKEKATEDTNAGDDEGTDDENDDERSTLASKKTRSRPAPPLSGPIVSPPQRIRVGPVVSSASRARSPSAPPPPSITDPLKPKRVFDPTDDSSVLTVAELDRDPDFVRPPKRTGPFFDTLQTKWTPVKELKKLAQEYGETYKQGKFSNSEDRLIKATIKSFRERSGMTSEELVTHINSKRGTSATAGFSIGGKKDGGGAGGGTVNYGGALSEMWLNLGDALQERALLGIWNRVKRMYNPDSGKGPWTTEEDEDLTAAVKEYGSSSWEKIASSVGRPSSDCRDRWVKQLGAGKGDVVKKGKWSKDEEDTLIKLHAELGNSWTAIVKRMGGTRTATQCRIKWSDSLSRKASAQPATPEVEASTSAVATPQTQDEEAGVDRAWKWKQEYFSTLVHAIAQMKVKDESELDFSTISDPTLKPQGIKNLRDRFKRLRQGAIFDIRERDGLDEDAKVPYQAVIDHLLALYPEPGKAYKRTYRAPEQKRLARVNEKEERKAAKADERRMRKEGKFTGVETDKSSAVVMDSDDDESSDAGDSE